MTGEKLKTAVTLQSNVHFGASTITSGLLLILEFTLFSAVAAVIFSTLQS